VAVDQYAPGLHGSRRTIRSAHFGWMAHVYLFAGDDPKVIWGEEHATMDVHTHRP
jgi:hypothetical protein